MINVSESFFYKDSLFIVATLRKEWLVVCNDILVSTKETKLAGIKEEDFLH
jgi:hypothetical protein